jgi:hypothetical protein
VSELIGILLCSTGKRNSCIVLTHNTMHSLKIINNLVICLSLPNIKNGLIITFHRNDVPVLLKILPWRRSHCRFSGDTALEKYRGR